MVHKVETLVKSMLSDTILALCRNTLSYTSQVCVEGLLGITVDDKEIFLVHMNDTIKKDKACSVPEKRCAESDMEKISDESSSQLSDSDSQSSPKKRRKRRRKSKDKSMNTSQEDELAKDTAQSMKHEDSPDAINTQPMADLQTDSRDSHDSHVSNSSAVGNKDPKDNSSETRVDIKEEMFGDYDDDNDDDDIVFVKEEPKDMSDNASAYGYRQSSPAFMAMPGTSQSSSMGMPNQDDLNHLQEISLHLSGSSQPPVPRTTQMVKLTYSLPPFLNGNVRFNMYLY